MKNTVRARKHGAKNMPEYQPQTPSEFKTICLRECPVDNPFFDNPLPLVNFWRKNVTAAPWFNDCKECFCVFFLNIHQQLTGFELVSVGTLDAVSFHVRDVFRPAIVHSAASILIAHNHPSGNPAPSDMDIKTTRDLARAGQLLKIQLVDHVIIGRAGGRIFKQGFVSLLELGYWDN